MARQQVVSFTVTCDVCGEEISEGDSQGASRKISWDGADYLVDMCARDQAALGAVLGQLKVFVDAGQEKAATSRRRAGAGRSASKARSRTAGPRPAAARMPGSQAARSNMPAIRAWALENGYQVGHRGRIPASVLAAYHQGQSGAPAAATGKRGRGRPRKTAASR